jgi:hypothetical protein
MNDFDMLAMRGEGKRSCGLTATACTSDANRKHHHPIFNNTTHNNTTQHTQRKKKRSQLLDSKVPWPNNPLTSASTAAYQHAIA